MMASLKHLILLAIIGMCGNSFAQIPTCSPNGNVVLFSNYDGGELNINIDQNIPNLKIGVCTYEPVRITISGPFAGNVTQVWYAGFNSIQNNNNCAIGNFPTSILGVPLSNQTILTAPPVLLNNPNGYNFGIICGYSCDINTNQGGCNTIDQIEDYFMTQFGGTLYSLSVQYCCWLDSDVYQVSQLAGSCCNNNTGTLSLTSAPGTDNQTVCINTPITDITYNSNNTIPTLSGLPNGVNYTFLNGTVTISGTPTIPGIYNYNFSLPGSCGNVQTITGTIAVNTYAFDTLFATACTSYTAPWGATYTQTGTYIDTLIHSTGCDSIIELNLIITGLPTITATTISASCGLSDGTATATATGGSGIYSYTWSNGATGNSATGLSAGNYTVTATDQNGCASTIQVAVSSDLPGGVSISANDTCLENGIQFSIQTAAPISNINWDFGDPSSGANNSSTLFTPTHQFSAAGTYTIRSIVTFACGVDTLFQTITITECDSVLPDCRIFVPNVFTPNGDFVNETFSPSISCSPEKYEFFIFNRWGGLIFKSSDPSKEWDGTFEGTKCTDGVYMYLLEYKLPTQQTKTISGTFSLFQ